MTGAAGGGKERQEIWSAVANSGRCIAPGAGNSVMLRLITQANLKVSRTGAVNLRLVDSVPNFAIPQNVVSQGFLANLKCLLTERGERIPGGANESEFLPQDFRASFVDNLKECLRPTPKLTGDAAYSLRGAASPGIKIESLPLYLSIFRNIRDRVIPPKSPSVRAHQQTDRSP